jgi:hypothetical protein
MNYKFFLMFLSYAYRLLMDKKKVAGFHLQLLGVGNMNIY